MTYRLGWPTICLKERRISTNINKLVLASSSPRRHELLRLAGVSFQVRPSKVKERVEQGERPENFTMRVALMKAQAVAKEVECGSFILAADTTVVLEDKILGKPRDVAHAERMLHLLSGRNHRVLTAVVLMQAPNRGVSRFLSQTTVWFRKLSDALIRGYVRTTEPMDKAGAYAIQGKGAMLVDSIQGSYTNVVGLPLSETVQMLQRAGIWYPFEERNHDNTAKRYSAGGAR